MIPPVPRLDVARAVRRVATAFWEDFAGIVIGGFVAVILPALVSAWVLADGGGTLGTTLRAVLAMVYVAMVSHGVIERLAGHPLPTGRFIRDGLLQARPGLEVALLLGAGVVVLLMLELLGRAGTLAGTALHALVAAGVIWSLCVLLPVVPVAVRERLRPMAAIRRAARLTRGNRDRIFALLVLAMLTLAPAAVLIAVVVEADGDRATTAGTLLVALFDLLVCSLLATVPPVVYAGLAEAADPTAAARRGDVHGDR